MGGFKVKGWKVSGDADSQTTVTDDQMKVDHLETYENVLGMKWNTEKGTLMFICRGFTEDCEGVCRATEVAVTKRKISSVVNSIYDPMGLLTPFTVKSKIILRKLWASSPKLDWDDPVPERKLD